jgi:hypothetical protein
MPSHQEADVKEKKPETHQHTPEEERDIREAALDETLEGTFPASDPSSSLPNPDDHQAAARQARHKRRRMEGGASDDSERERS